MRGMCAAQLCVLMTMVQQSSDQKWRNLQCYQGVHFASKGPHSLYCQHADAHAVGTRKKPSHR